MKVLFATLIIAAVVVAGCLWAIRPLRVPVDASVPQDFPGDGFSHEALESLLRQYTDADGRVDYAGWHTSAESISSLHAYLAAVSAYSPDNAPQRFPSSNDELVYWIQAYNAYVIKAVLDHWPLESVTDVKAPLEVINGMGFFYRLRYSFGGRYYSLLKVENGIIRKRHQDARIHYVLNTASESCPVLKPELPTGDELEEALALAASEFVADPQNVAIDHVAKTVTLSRIFKWFRKDFINDLHRRGLPVDNGLVDYVANVAPEALRNELASASDYEIRFADYDWSLNKQN
jgi:hypothetical protein